MRERVFNLFLFIRGDLIEEVGVVVHESNGDDGEKLRALQVAVATDCDRARRCPVPDRFRVVERRDGVERQIPGRLSYAGYQQLTALGRHLELFESLFEDVNAPPDPLTCITPIVDGEPRIEGVEAFGIGPLT